jgi:hypothetical protein
MVTGLMPKMAGVWQLHTLAILGIKDAPGHTSGGTELWTHAAMLQLNIEGWMRGQQHLMVFHSWRHAARLQLIEWQQGDCD